MAMSTDVCLGGHFCVEPGIFSVEPVFFVKPCILLSDQAFLGRTSVIIWLLFEIRDGRLLDIKPLPKLRKQTW